jgi:hypothetical protein
MQRKNGPRPCDLKRIEARGADGDDQGPAAGQGEG